MCDAFTAFWDGLAPGIQAAVIDAVVTVVTATVGVLVVFWQIGRQARNAIQQNRHNEALKLKLQVYEEIVSICQSASKAAIALSSYVRNFGTNASLARQFSRDGLPWTIPEARVPVLLEKKRAMDDGMIKIIGCTERWQIIDPRIKIFRTAIAVVREDIETTFTPYSSFVMGIMPLEMPEHPVQGTLFPWQPPDDQMVRELERLGEALLEALTTLMCYIIDIQAEMQNLLVGELFNAKISPRQPIDPKYKVLQLDRHKELEAYFENETDWGRMSNQVQSEVWAELNKKVVP